MISTKQYTDNYNRWTDHLRKSAEQIERASEARKFILLNLETASDRELLKVACECISDLVGDEAFRTKTRRYFDETN